MRAELVRRRLVALGAASLAVAGFSAGFTAAPSVAASASAGPSHVSSRYAQVSRAARLPSGAHDLGGTDATRAVSGAVALRPRDPAALERAAVAVSDPRSPSYHHYLAKDTFADRYGPTAATISAVESTLRASHLSVTSVSSNGLLVHFRGTAGAAQSAFRTRIANVRLASGRTGTETTTPLSFPADIASQVSGVVGLNTLARSSTSLKHATHPAAVKPVTPRAVDDVAGAPSPCPGATNAAIGLGGLTDTQIADAYGVDGLYNVGDFGAGQTVAIYELEPFSSTDVSTFDKCYFGSAKAAQMAGRLHTVDVDGGGGSGPGSGESILDIEDVSALAPAATIDVYEAPNTTAGALDEYDDIVQADSAQVVTSSWGFCELDEINLEPGYINVENALFEQAALQGQTVLNASGDAGSDECAYGGADPVAPKLSQSDPASQPFVLGVGGTTILSATNPPSETTWNDGNVGGGSGGGPSSIWGAPSWQQPFITGADKTAAAVAVTADGLEPCKQSADASLCREVPDVSAQADEFTGAVTIYTSIFDGWTTEGGTSSSAPLWAAILAEINASSGCDSSPLGFVAPALYGIASIPAEYAKSFNDVVQGNNDVYDLFHGKAFAAGSGYDMATGLGSPMVTGPGGSAGLANFLCALTPPPAPPVITSMSSPTVSPSTGTLTVNGTGFAGAKGVSIDAYAVPSADVTITGDTKIVISPVPTAAQVGTASFGPQDGTGRAVLSVTGADGATSALNAASTLLYVNGTSAAPVPSVEGVAAYGGARAGGNKVSVFGSGFAATGPDAITGVTVGGVEATAYTVVNPAELSVTIPSYRSATTCAAADTDPTHDVCQAQVVVTNANGSSSPATIRPPYTGQYFFGVSGGRPLPGCVTSKKCEIVAAVSEYDYLPVPTITSVTTTSTHASKVWASELGTTIATVKGSGFDYLGIEYANVGPASLADSQDFALLAVGPRQFQIVLNGRTFTRASLRLPFTVQTLGGRSGSVPVTYAGVPSVTSISPSAAPDTGGKHVVVRGTGLDGAGSAAGGRLSFSSSTGGASERAVSHYSVISPTSLKVTTPAIHPGSLTLMVCTITRCSRLTGKASARHALVDFYQPKPPKVTSVSVRSGPASGGTLVVIHGRRLADAVRVTFGRVVAGTAKPPAVLAGTAHSLVAVAPPGRAGTTVHIRVKTVQTLVTGDPASPPGMASTFTYHSSVASAPRHLSVKPHAASFTVRWAAPASDGGHPIRHYRVSAVPVPGSHGFGAKPPPAVVVRTGSGAARSVRLTHLWAGWSYAVKVWAVTSKGRGLTAWAGRRYSLNAPV